MSRKPLVKRLSVGVIDQFVSSGANFAMTLYAARRLSADGFGAFSLAMVSIMFAVNLVRCLVSESMLIRPGDTRLERRARAGRAASSAALVGLLASGVFAVAGMLTSGATSGCFFVLAGTAPLLLVQDTMRFVAFARADPAAALLSDTIWAVGQLVCFVAIATLDSASAELVLVGWAVPAGLGAAVHLVRYQVVPAFRTPMAWITENRDLSYRYAVDYLGNQGASQLGIYTLAGVAGVAAVGGLRGSHTLFGLLNVLSAGSLSVLVPEGRRLVARSMRALDRMSALVAVVFFLASVAAMVVFLVMPDSFGEALLGSTWESARKLIIPTGLGMAGSGVLVGLRAGLRSMAGAAELLGARIFTAPAAVLLPLVGSIWSEAMGAAIGLTISVWWSVLFYVRAYRQAARRYLREQAEASGLAADHETPAIDLGR
ncbi:MAG: hypothetical protein GX643_12885 [Acidimicrobiales bacterium]|nr:hypothetical protein [Acidimicrobiales bacterium]